MKYEKNKKYSILGYELKYLGEFNSINDVPNELGFYTLLSTNELYARHPKNEYFKPLQIQAMSSNIQNISNDRVIRKRERMNKEILEVEIMPDDNHLKVLIKQIIQNNDIDLKDYRHKFKSDNHLNNMKRLLVADNNMTWEKFLEWLDILEYEYKLGIQKR